MANISWRSPNDVEAENSDDQLILVGDVDGKPEYLVRSIMGYEPEYWDGVTWSSLHSWYPSAYLEQYTSLSNAQRACINFRARLEHAEKMVAA